MSGNSVRPPFNNARRYSKRTSTMYEKRNFIALSAILDPVDMCCLSTASASPKTGLSLIDHIGVGNKNKPCVPLWSWKGRRSLWHFLILCASAFYSFHCSRDSWKIENTMSAAGR